MPEAENAPAVRHVAVLLAGAFVYPEVERSWPLLFQRVIAPHNASSFVFLDPDSTLLPSDPPHREWDRNPISGVIITRLPNPKGTSAPVDSLCAAAGALMGSALTRCNAGRVTLPYPSADQITHNARLQYAKVCEANKLRLEYERQTGVIHALVVRARFDLVFHAPLALPRLPLRSLLRRRTAWVIADPKECKGYCLAGRGVYHLPNHAIDHIFVLSWLTAETLCSLAATLPAIPSACSPGWIPEGQLLRHWLRVGEVRLLPVPKELQLRSTSKFPEGPPFFGFDAPRVTGTVMLLQYVQLKWICAVRHGCNMPITNVSGVPEPTDFAQTIMGWAGGDQRARRPEWFLDTQGCVRHVPLWRNRLLRVPTGNLTLGALLNRTFDAALLADCATRGYC
jgi:hypothetical protein